MFPKKRTIKSFIILTFIILFGFPLLIAQTIETQDSIILCGKIEKGGTSNNLSFRFYKDFLTFQEKNYPATLYDDSFHIKIFLPENTPGFIVFGNVNVPVFVEKKDSIHITGHVENFSKSLMFSGIGGLANNYLQETFIQFDLNDAKRIEDGITKNTAENYQKLLIDYKKEKIAYLDTFLIKRDTHFTTSFSEYVQADINYWWGQNLMRYRIDHPVSKELPVSLTLPEAYFHFMDTLKLNNEAALNNLNYLFYLEEYTKWRQERISKGKLQFKNTNETKKEFIKVKMVETFGQVLIDKLEVRKEAYDGLSAFAHLERGAEVLYLQDITTDRFSYPFKGKRYRDKFLKIELPDGRIGWVFRGGINLKQKIVYAKKWVEVPDTSPELMRNFKYANFKGKVLHYAIAKDLYWEVLKKGEKDHYLLKDYLANSDNNLYSKILKEAYKEVEQTINTKADIPVELPIPKQEKIVRDSNTSITELLKKITTTTARDLKEKEESILRIAENTKKEIAQPDFSRYARNTTIKGKIEQSTINRPELVVNLNPLLREETNYNFPEEIGTDFHFDFSLKSTTTATLKLGKEQVTLYLQPSYELTMDLKGNSLYEDLFFTGEGSAINNYLVAATGKFYQADLEVETNIRFASPQAFKALLTKVKNEKLTFLRKYIQSHSLSTEVMKYARADIIYWYAYNLMNYPYENPIFHNQPSPMPVPMDYYDFMEEVSINNTAALPNQYYLYYIQDYLSFNSDKLNSKGLDRYQLAERYLKGKPLYFYKALQLSIETKRADTPMIEEKINNFINNCPYKIFEEYVKLAYHENRGITEGMDAPSFELADINGNIVSLTDFKNKVLFIDFWATWCQPCIRLLPAHKKLQKQFGKDNVAFIYISMDKNANNWRNFLAKGGFPGTHLFASPKSIEKYKVETLPYSLLIDPEGKIVWHHNGGFSVQRMAQRILELLQ